MAPDEKTRLSAVSLAYLSELLRAVNSDLYVWVSVRAWFLYFSDTFETLFFLLNRFS